MPQTIKDLKLEAINIMEAAADRALSPKQTIEILDRAYNLRKAEGRLEVLEELEKQLPEEKMDDLDKDDPDNYGAHYAIAGFNDALSKTKQIIKSLRK
jgi:hypothetical protein